MSGTYIKNNPHPLSQRLELLHSIIIRNLKVKYQRSVLGFIWTLLNPLITVAVLSTVFSYVIRIDIENYWAFLLSGYFAWNFSQLVIGTGAYVLNEHAQVIRSIEFPLEFLILGAGLAKLIEFSVELIMIIAVISFFIHDTIPISYSIIPVILILNFLIVTGIQFIIATFSVYYQDVQHALPLGIITLFYLSPVFYPLEMIPDNLINYFMINPFAHILSCYHSVIFEGVFPDPFFLISSLLFGVFLSLTGWFIFHKHRHVIPEII